MNKWISEEFIHKFIYFLKFSFILCALMLDPLELDLQAAVRCYVGTGN